MDSFQHPFPRYGARILLAKPAELEPLLREMSEDGFLTDFQRTHLTNMAKNCQLKHAQRHDAYEAKIKLAKENELGAIIVEVMADETLQDAQKKYLKDLATSRQLEAIIDFFDTPGTWV